MAAVQAAKPKKADKKVKPGTGQEAAERPASAKSHNSWVEDLDKPASRKSSNLSIPTPSEVTDVQQLPRSPSPVGGSLLSVKEAVEEDRVSNIDDEEFDPPLAPRPESMAGSRPSTPVTLQNRPQTPTTPIDRGRTLSPTPAAQRSRSSSPLPIRKTSKIAPTDQTNVEQTERPQTPIKPAFGEERTLTPTHGERPQTPIKPAFEEVRTLSPTPSAPRSRSSSPLPKRKTSKVTPTDQPDSNSVEQGDRPKTPITPAVGGRTLSPTPSAPRSRSSSPLPKRKTSKVAPADQTVAPVSVDRVEAWSDAGSVVDMNAVNQDNTSRRSSAASLRPQSRPTRSPGEGSHVGRSTSMHSLISVQEASTDNRIDGTAADEKTARTRSAASLRSQQDDTKSIVSTTSGRLKPPRIENEQQAYVPFIYARDCLAKVMDDMMKMKQNHIRIVGLIEDAYKKIEDETQAQFNVFVIGMRDQYKGKVKTFRQIIHVHQEDFGNHKTYWQDTLESLNSRNKALLKDKKRLMVINKIEIERLEKEKEELMTELSQKIDHGNQENVKTNKMLEESSQEVKILQDQITSEKDEKEQLKKEIESLKASGQATETIHTTETNLEDASGLQEENQRLKEEIERLKSMSDSEVQDEASRGVSGSVGVGNATVVVTSAASEQEIKTLKEERNKMQEEKIDAQKELAILRTKYNTLQSQYTVIAATASSEENKNKIQEQIDSVKKDHEIMQEEGEQLKEEINQWKINFKEQTGREPTEEDRSESLQELETQLAEVENKQEELDTKREFMKALQDGHVPEVKEAEIAEPIVKEVIVPDPSTVAALEASQQQCTELQARIASLEKTIKDKDREMKKMSKERPKVTSVDVAGGQEGGVDSEEVSSLQERIEELEDENKHLESTVEQLEDKIKDLESGESVKKPDFSMLDVEDDVDEDDVEGFSAQLAAIRGQVDDAEKKLAKEQEQHEKTKAELEDLRQQFEKLTEEKETVDGDVERKVNTATMGLKAELEMKEKALEENKKQIEELEQEKLKGVPVDTAKEITKLQEKLRFVVLEKEAVQKEKIGGSAELEKLRADNVALTEKLRKEQENTIRSQDAFSKKLSEKEKKAKEQVSAVEQKYQQREADTRKQVQSLEKKIKELSTGGGGGGGKAGAAGGKAGKVDAKTEKKLKLYQEQVASLKKQIVEEQNKAKAAKDELKESRSGGTAEKMAGKKMEKQMKDLEKKYENEQKKYEKANKKATDLEAELKSTNKELDGAKDENKKLQVQIDSLGVAAKEALELKEKADEMKAELKTLKSENKSLTENYNSERVLRKKYYNQIEDMKGKIRVYCRGRPLSGSEKERGNYEIVKAPDEYTIQVESSRGNKEFQFDHIFLAGSTQEEIFEDTNNLIQSAVDGYNVCIFAYGQTGSGKTFTMIGDKEQKFPGIAPRAFNRIFEVIEESKSKFSFKVSTYMLELYNEKLIDLYAPHGKEPVKLDIKKDQKGMVFINGSVVQDAANAKELYGLFDSGSLNRHVASTKMNSESSRSHLVIGVIIESTNLSTGTVVKGKLSLVDLAGSERAAKTGATAEQLKEANSINKSLSALGDVISALSSEQSFIPYRNNKLTMLMQDSLGGNAKTLMFVNISPADYNAEETIISLTYASRVKLITNDASKNADNKEIARLKKIITKLKSGEDVDEEEVQ